MKTKNIKILNINTTITKLKYIFFNFNIYIYLVSINALFFFLSEKLHYQNSDIIYP